MEGGQGRDTYGTRRDNRGGLLRAVLVYEYRGGYRVRNTRSSIACHERVTGFVHVN